MLQTHFPQTVFWYGSINKFEITGSDLIDLYDGCTVTTNGEFPFPDIVDHKKLIFEKLMANDGTI